MRGTELYRLLGGAASENTTRMNEVFLKHYHEGMNEMFARLHAEQHNAAGTTGYVTEYHNYLNNFHQSVEHTGDVHVKTGSTPLEYDRYKFHRNSEANLFIQEMRKEGVEVTVAPFRMNGEILVEIPKVIESADENGSVKRRTSQQLVETYQEQTGYEVKHYSYYEDYGDAQKAYTQGTAASAGYGIVQSEFLNNMGEFGAVLRFVDQMDRLSTRHGDDNQKHAFTAPTRHDGAGQEVGGRWSGTTDPRYTKTATVLNGDTVIIDGKEVHDREVAAAIIGKHERREEFATRYVSRYGEAQQAVYGHITGHTPNGAERILGLQDGDSRLTMIHSSKTNRTIAANARDVMLSIKKQNYSTGIEKHGRYDEGSIGMMRNEYGMQGVMLNKIAGDAEITDDVIEFLQKAKLNGNLTRTQEEFIDRFIDDVNSKLWFTGKNGGKLVELTFDDKINIINITKKAQAYNERHGNLSAAEVAVADRINKYAEDGGEFRLSKAEAAMFGSLNSPSSVKNQIDALYDDLGVQFHFQRQLGNNLEARQIRLINTELEGMLAAKGVTYDEAQGRFVRANGQALNERALRRELREGAIQVRTDEAKAAAKIFDGKAAERKGRRRGNRYANSLDLKLARAGVEITKDGRLVHSHCNDISEWDILKMDKAFLTRAQERGYNFVTVGNTLDVKSIANLKKPDLQKLGISEETRQALLRFHDKDGNILKQLNYGGAASWGNSLHKLRGEIAQRGIGSVSKLAGGGSKLIGEGDAETAQAMQTFSSIAKMPQRVKQVSAYVWQGAQGASQRVDWVKQRLAHNNNAGNGRPAKKKPEKKKKPVKAETRKVNPQAVQKKLDKDEKRLARMKASEARLTKYQNLIHKFDIKQRAIEWAGKNTLVGRLAVKISAAAKKLVIKVFGKLLAAFMGVYALISGIVLLCVLICCVIQAMCNLPYEGFKKLVAAFTDDTPAIIKLYNYMEDDLQDDWLEGLSDYDQKLENCADIKYGIAYEDLTTYLSGMTENDIIFDGSDMKINPFYKIEGLTVPDENLTPVTSYDGANVTQLVTNPSVYGEKAEGISCESGHTNNLKDILAMTDVMYKFDLNRSDDDTLTDILMQPAAIINFEHFWSEVFGRLKYAGKCVLHFFGLDSEPDYPDPSDYWGGTVSYGTIQNYVTYLWNVSHQEQLTLNTEYYKMGTYEANIDGTMTDITSSLSQENASYLQICTNPVTSKFPIAYDNSHDKIYPYLEKDDGTKADLSNAANMPPNVKLSMDTTNVKGHLVEGEDPCLWEDMASDEATFNAIKAREEAWGDDCWLKNGGETETYESFTATSGWFDSESDAKSDAKAKVQARSDEIAGDSSALSVPDPYFLSTDRNFFTHKWKEACNKHGEQVGATETNSVYDGEEEVDAWWDADYSTIWNVDKGHGKAYKIFVNGEFKVNADWDYVYWETSEGRHILHYWLNGEHTYDAGSSSETHNASCENYKMNKAKYKTQYRVTWKADVSVLKTQGYKRVCEGHEFVYCGGHVACHVNGCVYSTTNEQMALAGTQLSEDLVPKAKYKTDGTTEYKLAENGYESILGKIKKSEVDYSTVSNAATSGGCESAATNIQGSDVVRGLNLWVEGEGISSNSDGMQLRDDISPQVYRDIFDVDMALDKACNVFPWGAGDSGWRKYEAWTTDNMTFVASRVSVDWNDIYGFDIPLEIGAVSLSEDDINLIIDGLKAEYGISENREEAVRFALRWVGKGHYSKNHTDHAFLDKLCKGSSLSHTYGGTTYSTSYDMCCSAANSKGFVDFYWNHFDKGYMGSINPAAWLSATGGSTMKPADVVRHEPVATGYGAYEFSSSDLDDGGTSLRKGLEEIRDRDAYVIYIGTLNNSIFDDAGEDEIELSNGYVIHRGVPMTVDLSPAPSKGLFDMGTNGSGCVFFRSEESVGYGEAKCTQNFYWFTHPDAKTKFVTYGS